MPPHATGQYVSGSRKAIAAYRVEGEEGGVGKHKREDDAGPRRHEQDRSPGCGVARGARAARTGRLPHRTEEGHEGEVYELTGPRLLTFEEAVGEIARAANREIRYVPVSMPEFESLLAEQEVPDEYVWLLTYLFTEVLDGRNAYLTDGVQRALGREPRDFADYARETAATGVWSKAA